MSRPHDLRVASFIVHKNEPALGRVKRHPGNGNAANENAADENAADANGIDRAYFIAQMPS